MMYLINFECGGIDRQLKGKQVYRTKKDFIKDVEGLFSWSQPQFTYEEAVDDLLLDGLYEPKDSDELQDAFKECYFKLGDYWYPTYYELPLGQDYYDFTDLEDFLDCFTYEKIADEEGEVLLKYYPYGSGDWPF